MKTSNSKYLYILLFTILSAPVFGNLGEGDKNPNQNNWKPGYNFFQGRDEDSPNYQAFKNLRENNTLDEQVDLNIQALGVGLGLKKRVYKAFFLGIEGGGGFAINYSIDPIQGRSGSQSLVEKYFIELNSVYIPNSSWEFSFGVSKIKVSLDEESSQLITSMRFGVFVGNNRTKFGIKLSAGKDEIEDSFFYTSLLIVRVHLNR